jgi:4-aminobutyrate aminotransferase-like enzyme
VGGFITPPVEYFEIAVDIVRKHGGVFISDEVQTGFGRLGGKMFGIEHWGVEPDIMTMAKGVANGMPMGVTVATDEIAAAWDSLTLSTFGGNPMSCAAANATIATIEGQDLCANAERQGARLREGLEKIQSEHPRVIGDVRGMGLMQGVELVADETAGDRTPNLEATARIFEETKKRGLLIGKGGLHGNALRVAPPLTVNADQVDEALRALGESFDALEA